MATMYCALCQRPVEARRHFGVGSLGLCLLTGGIWLLALPFYAKRCSICRSAAVSQAGAAGALGDGGAHPRLSDLEQRLSRAESELEAAGTELDHLRTERDFYRQLIGDPAKREREQRGG